MAAVDLGRKWSQRDSAVGGFELAPRPGDTAWGGCVCHALGDQRLHRGEAIAPTRCSTRPAHDETCKLRIERTQFDGLPCDQMHRRAKKMMSAKGREPHDHEIALADSFAQPMAVMEADNPGAVMIDPFLRLIEPPMRRTEVQDQGYFDRRKVSFANRIREKTRAGKIAPDECAKLRMRAAMRRPPLSQLRFVRVDLHAWINSLAEAEIIA
jgi:hypothetical protein